MQDSNMKGITGEYIIPLQSYIDETFSDAERTVIYEQLSPEVMAALPNLKPTGVYPIPTATELFRGIDKVLADPEKVSQHVIAFGRRLAAVALTTFMKLLFKILTPKLLTAKFPAIYSRFHPGGTLVADVSEIHRNKIRFRTEGYDYLHFMATGWILCVYEQLGKKNVRVSTNVPTGQANVPELLSWDVSWD